MQQISLKEIFFTIFRINAITFGGGYTIMPILKNEFVEKKKLLSEEEMLDILAIAQSGPGALAISTSLLTGYRLRGKAGAITATIAGVLPCLVIISILYYFYHAFAENALARNALRGMSGVISAVLVLSVYNLAKTALKRYRELSIVCMVAAFLLSWFTEINTAIIIACLALTGLVIFSFFVKEDLNGLN